MKISRGMTTRKRTTTSVDLTAGGTARFVPRWATTRSTVRGVAVAGSLRRIWRGYVSRGHGATIP